MDDNLDDVDPFQMTDRDTDAPDTSDKAEEEVLDLAVDWKLMDRSHVSLGRRFLRFWQWWRPSSPKQIQLPTFSAVMPEELFDNDDNENDNGTSLGHGQPWMIMEEEHEEDGDTMCLGDSAVEASTRTDRRAPPPPPPNPENEHHTHW
jgi:hypothetical protein